DHSHADEIDNEAMAKSFQAAGVPVGTLPGGTESILQEAQRIIHGPRRDGYGHPRKNFADTAAVWSVLLGTTVTSRQVGQCMIALKLCRDMKKPGRDNLTDIAGYAGCMELIDEAQS
ncbi:MAG TPA: DUF6378 domain-containing protein, partial [Methylophilaceae bacterium]|nr:DUF6378 domain-containing protein [Methylophilaceae bacterium]